MPLWSAGSSGLCAPASTTVVPSPLRSTRTRSWLAVGMTAPVVKPIACRLSHQDLTAGRALAEARPRNPVSSLAWRYPLSLRNRASGNICDGIGGPLAAPVEDAAAAWWDIRGVCSTAVTAAAATITASAPPVKGSTHQVRFTGRTGGLTGAPDGGSACAVPPRYGWWSLAVICPPWMTNNPPPPEGDFSDKPGRAGVVPGGITRRGIPGAAARLVSLRR